MSYQGDYDDTGPAAVTNTALRVNAIELARLMAIRERRQTDAMDTHLANVLGHLHNDVVFNNILSGFRGRTGSVPRLMNTMVLNEWQRMFIEPWQNMPGRGGITNLGTNSINNFLLAFARTERNYRFFRLSRLLRRIVQISTNLDYEVSITYSRYIDRVRNLFEVGLGVAIDLDMIEEWINGDLATRNEQDLRTAAASPPPTN